MAGVQPTGFLEKRKNNIKVEVGASLSMIKSLGGVEAGLFMLVILEL